MKITFIGTSHGVPEPNRKCSCIMIETGKNVYFVDMGTSAIEALRTKGISIDAVKGVFITHMHGDHTNALPQFVDLLSWYFTTADPVICLPVPEAANAIQSWVRATLNEAERIIQYRETTPGVVFDDGVLKATAIPTQHCRKSYAYLIEAEGKSVLFAGDLRRPGIDFPAVDTDNPVDLAICESAHFPAMEYLPVFEKSNFKKICITHYVNQFIPSILELQEKLKSQGLPLEIATDNFELTL